MSRIDLRSDTLTKPTQGMREAMMNAELGDDVFSEDPTINGLQDHLAQLFGFEAGLFCTSGTQANQIAIGVHTRPGDEVICSSLAHIYLYEGGGIAQNSGCSVRLIGDNQGMFTAEEVAQNINANQDYLPRTQLVSVEDTVNKGGGAVWNFAELTRISTLCRSIGIPFHCDGARVFNALNVTGILPVDYGAAFDSISICLSKGLGAPVGSVLLGSAEFIRQARRRRKSMGGGMRQAGMLAAAGLYALYYHIDRLQEDHDRAKATELALSACTFVKAVMPVQTNIVIFELRNGIPAEEAVRLLAEEGVICFAFGPTKVRFVFHLDITHDMMSPLLSALQRVENRLIANATTLIIQ